MDVDLFELTCGISTRLFEGLDLNVIRLIISPFRCSSLYDRSILSYILCYMIFSFGFYEIIHALK